jgi:(p)ppGpp synthase/HD superfamily hydrolase
MINKKMINQDKITKAWFFASRVHNGQLYPGEKLPYITHLGNVMMEVMAVASSLENAELTIICAILHDTIEDTPTSHEEIEKAFSLPVADGVLALTKNETLETKREQMLDSLERIKMQPKEVWVVKMADRVANLGEPPHYWDSEKRKRYQDEAQIILDHLAKADEVMANRLRGKIDNYSKYI